MQEINWGIAPSASQNRPTPTWSDLNVPYAVKAPYQGPSTYSRANSGLPHACDHQPMDRQVTDANPAYENDDLEWPDNDSVDKPGDNLIRISLIMGAIHPINHANTVT